LQPKIYSFGEHNIAPEKIDPHANLVIQKLREAGYTAYLVGGGVRDLLLNQQPKDFDVSTSAKPEEVRNLFRNSILIGRRFRLAHIRFGKKIIEVSTFRSGGTEDAGLILRDNEWGTEEQDVLRRDFTINGLFYEPESQKIIDYVDGYLDLEKRVLRAIGQPDVRFIQDPVRMIRLVKFCARYNFNIHDPTLKALKTCKDEIVKSSPARILEELLRMLESGFSKPFFQLLNEYGLLQSLSPLLSHFLENDPNQKAYKLLGAIDNITKQGLEHPLDRSLLLACLVLPVFKDKVIEKNKTSERSLHLGQVSDIAYQAIDEIFQPFFNIPRRMRGISSFLLTCQFRFVPIDRKPIRKPKVPRDALLPLALQLLQLRSIADPALEKYHQLWTETASQSLANTPTINSYKRRRRRRKRREPQ
jgi:poly(A) polymerase